MTDRRDQQGLHIYVHSADSGSVDLKLDQILTRLTALRAQGTTTMATVAEVKAAADAALVAVQEASTTDDSIIALVNSQMEIILAIREQLADAIASGNNPAELQAVLDALTTVTTSTLADSARVAAAVATGTPAA